ncbi:MAG: BAR domain-containing protein, partial [Bacilli bacterium]|nr:BAR domain-containing protein [Bacilli bacterium]
KTPAEIREERARQRQYDYWVQKNKEFEETLRRNQEAIAATEWVREIERKREAEREALERERQQAEATKRAREEQSASYQDLQERREQSGGVTQVPSTGAPAPEEDGLDKFELLQWTPPSAQDVVKVVGDAVAGGVGAVTGGVGATVADFVAPMETPEAAEYRKYMMETRSADVIYNLYGTPGSLVDLTTGTVDIADEVFGTGEYEPTHLRDDIKNEIFKRDEIGEHVPGSAYGTTQYDRDKIEGEWIQGWSDGLSEDWGLPGTLVGEAAKDTWGWMQGMPLLSAVVGAETLGMGLAVAGYRYTSGLALTLLHDLGVIFSVEMIVDELWRDMDSEEEPEEDGGGGGGEEPEDHFGGWQICPRGWRQLVRYGPCVQIYPDPYMPPTIVPNQYYVPPPQMSYDPADDLQRVYEEELTKAQEEMQKQYDDALDAAEKEYQDAIDQYEDAIKDYEEATREYDEASQEYQDAAKDYEDAIKDYEDAAKDYEDAVAQIEDQYLRDQEEYARQVAEYEQELADYVRQLEEEYARALEEHVSTQSIPTLEMLAIGDEIQARRQRLYEAQAGAAGGEGYAQVASTPGTTTPSPMVPGIALLAVLVGAGYWWSRRNENPERSGE